MENCSWSNFPSVTSGAVPVVNVQYNKEVVMQKLYTCNEVLDPGGFTIGSMNHGFAEQRLCRRDGGAAKMFVDEAAVLAGGDPEKITRCHLHRHWEKTDVPLEVALQHKRAKDEADAKARDAREAATRAEMGVYGRSLRAHTKKLSVQEALALLVSVAQKSAGAKRAKVPFVHEDMPCVLLPCSYAGCTERSPADQTFVHKLFLHEGAAPEDLTAHFLCCAHARKGGAARENFVTVANVTWDTGAKAVVEAAKATSVPLSPKEVKRAGQAARTAKGREGWDRLARLWNQVAAPTC